MRDAEVFKHFKVNEEEYVLYQNTNSVSIGLISQNKILTPPSDRINLLMNILGNLISSTPNNDFNTANNCVILSNTISLPLEEIGFQNVNIPLDKLINDNNTKSGENANPFADDQKKYVVNKIPNDPNLTTVNIKSMNTKPIIYGVIIVLLLVVLVLVILNG